MAVYRTGQSGARPSISSAALFLLVPLLFAALPAHSIEGSPAPMPMGPPRPLMQTPVLLAQNEAPASGEEHAAGDSGKAEAEAESPLTEAFHWFNFALLAGALVYASKKLLAPYLESRGRAIREEMEQSARQMAEASARLSVIEEKMRRLDSEITALRQAGAQEAAAERARLEEAASADAAKIAAAAEQEIAAAVKAARQELKAYAAELAVRVAEKRIRESLTPAAEQRVLKNFLDDLARPDDPAGSRNGGRS